MTSDPFARSRLRKVLVAVILATIPCYCAGMVAILLAPGTYKPCFRHPNPYPHLDAGGICHNDLHYNFHPLTLL